MAAKTQQIFELLQDTTKSLSGYKNWTDFLKSAAWQYKYPFEDQVLIYAQRPDATACAKIEVWNNSMHRWINRGAKGIALLRENGNRYGLEYVFDVSDTNDRYNRDVRLWKYDERYNDAIIETLSNTFGDLKVDVTVSDAILCAAHNAVADNKADYLHELQFVKAGSLLRGLDDVNLDLRFRQTAEVSVAYMVMQRMGITQDMFDEYEFQYIQDFNTPETMNILGNAVSSISETALRSISETIRAEQKREKFAQQQNNVYNRSEKNIDNVNIERNEVNGRNNIQDERRLSDTRTDSTDGGAQDRQIRDDAQNISQGTPPEPVHNTSDEGRTAQSFGGDRQDSDRTGTESGGQHGESGGRDGDNEVEGSVEMDGLNEQLSPFSRGDRAERTGVQLSLFDITLPSEEEQRNIIAKAEQSRRSAFAISQQIIDEVLTTGGNDRDSVQKICVQYSKNKSAEDNIVFLKKEYGMGGKGFQFDNSKVSVWWNEDGMRIAYGDRAIGRGELITWDRVDKRIGELLETGRFAPQETLDGLNELERKTAATNFYEMYRDCNRDEYPELREYFNTEWFKGSYPDTVDNLTELFKQPENVMAAIAAADALNVLYVDDENIMRFRWYSPDKVLPLLQDLRLEHKTFVSDKASRISPTFITEDEIDKLLIGSTKYSTQKIETYLYFKENTDAQERIKFLKERYGIGGGASGVFWNKHDAKGISFSRSDIFSPFAKVTLPWNKVEKRIDGLIKAGKYLTEREINEDIPRYQSEQEQQRIKNEKYMYLHDMDNLSAAEKRETLPKRIQYFTDIMENYEKGFFREYGVEHLLGKTEIVIGEAIRDNETRRKLSECMNKIGGSATDVLSRNCGYKFAEELNELKVIDFHKVGDFYEMYGDEAVEAAKVLETTLTRKQIDGEYVAMTGIPAFAVERYAELLGKNGYIANFRDADRNEPLARAQMLISEFCEEEYGDIPDFGDLSKIGIAHTTTEDDLHTIQVNADLIDFTISRYIDNQLVDERRYNSLPELIENELAGMTFDDLVYFTQEQLAPFYEENTGKEYELGFGKLGNGTTVWNRLEEENHDYKTVAHISDSGEVKYYEDLPDDVKQLIEEQAVIDKAEYEERSFRDTMYDVPYTEIYRSMSAYNELKEHNPESLIIIQVGSHYETLGDDAEIAGQLWDSYMLERQLPGSEMKAAMTGFTLSDEWQLYKDILTEAGYNVLVASDMGDDGMYRSISRFPAEEVSESEIKITDRDIFNQYTAMLIPVVTRDKTYINAHINSSDSENIRIECDSAVDKAVRNIPVEGNERFHRLYEDNADFQKRMKDRIFKVTYTDVVRKVNRALNNGRTQKLTTEQRNYNFINSIAPEIVSGEARYMRFAAGEAMMPLTVEKLTDTRVSVSHTYTQNGDLMYDPELEFEIDADKGELSPRTYRQDNMGIYQYAELENGQINAKLVSDLNSFTRNWFNNIRHSGYVKEQAIIEFNGNDITLSYDKDGNVAEIIGDDETVRQYESELSGHEQEEFNKAEYEERSSRDADIIGKELTIDDRKFVVERVGEISGDVTLRDITFENGVGFPINRIEKIDTVRRILKEQEQENLIPHIEKPKPAPNTVIYPEIPMSERHNFRITDDNLGHGTPTQKYERNVQAIKLLKTLEDEHRLATPDEQEILSQYVGWGGLADCFDERNSHYAELKSLLTADEYSAARESTLTAFYTPPVVIRSVYKALENMGLKQGNILDPAMGVGNFEGMLPDSMSDCKMYGIELDSISGRIAQQLYQKNAVTVQGYEDTTLPDSFFDSAIGNVPFANVKVLDRKYNKHKFLIHDYFFAKTLDKVRPGGVVAFITSSGTMDKKNSNVRKYIAQRADLIGAIRLPDNTFKANAGTEVTSDILFLQKRDRMTDIMPEWVNLGTDENGHTMNQYFVDNPDMILGDMIEESGPFGMQLNCKAYEGADLGELLDGAIQNIHVQITEYEFEDISNDEDLSIPADPNVKNFSYTVVDGDIYFRENSRMNKVDVSLTAQNRIKGMIEIRDCVKELIEYQTEDYPDSEIKEQQAKLNRLYDDFTAKYGLINSRGNNMAFSSDSSYFLLCSLEVLNDNGELERKADMFTKRTIGAKKEISHVDTASEALAVSLGEKARIDMEFMSQLTGKTENELFEELKGVIFLNPLYDGTGVTQEKYLTADEYLSGNVREKLEWAKRSAELYLDDYTVNVEALTAVQPKDLTAAEITVRLGTTWIPPEYIKEFTFELLTPSYFAKRQIDVHYSKLTGNWNVSGKSSDRGNVKINSTYGTHRINALKIIEDTLNLRDVRIFDYKENEKGNRVPVLNSKETTIAQQKQEAIKAAFDDWIWKNPERREHLTKLYNEKFNSFRTREYDGSHITFSGMNPEIQLRQHQKNAVARIMYGGNSLLGHVVGAGKTWTMAAAAMESKRLGLCNKPLFVVPNHLTEQWASEFLQLYPAANILVTTKKDFETKNRKKFCGRIATGDYDAIIIGHSQFEKIPMSSERQEAILRQQLHEILDGIAEAKSNNAERFTIKQMERTKKSIESKIKKLNDTSRKDDVVTFEELGVDRMFVDEAHNYKNLFLVSKMRNVGGIAQTDAQKSSDMFMKCRYLDEITGGKGNIFATGTPISNSMVELYTMQRYLQYDTLAKNDLQHFDAWASTFGETVTAIELAPEGTGYRAKTRFAKFYNIPELMTMFREVADIQTADMLKLPVPEAEYHNVAVEPTEIQREMVAELGNRAETVRNGGVDPTVDNMLKITNDGRKLALDQRLMNDMLPDEQGTKVAACADNVFDIWQKTSDFKGTQLVFCDSSTPKKDGSFNVYDDIHDKLISKGVPESDIAFIHDADSDVKKKELFAKVRKGDVRILLGSTQKMGAGTNVQTRLYASHDLDCPWRPSDLEQRAGRIIRQGNTNETVHIYRYVTKDTFDSYSYQLVENKQKFISQIMTSKSPVRSAEDIDETALSYAEIKALATGNPHIKEKMELDTEVAKLKLLKASFMSQKYELEDKVIKYFPQEIKKLTEMIAGAEKDIVTVQNNPKSEEKFNVMTIDGLGYYEKEKAGNALIERCKTMTSTDPVVIGEYRGFTMILSIDTFANEHKMTLQGSRSYTFPLGADVFGNIQRIDNALSSIEKLKSECEQKLTETKNQFEIAKVESKKDFPKESELAEKTQRLAALDALLNIDKREPQAVDMVPDEGDMPKKKNREMER